MLELVEVDSNGDGVQVAHPRKVYSHMPALLSLAWALHECGRVEALNPILYQ